MFGGSNGQAEGSFGIALFYYGPAVRGLEPKEQHDSCPLDWRLYDYVLGDTDCTVGVSTFAPPTHG